MSGTSVLSPSPSSPHSKRLFKNFASCMYRAIWVIVAPIIRPLRSVARSKRAEKFRREILSQMTLTIPNLHPDVVIGATDRSGRYTEVYLEFGEFRVRITRAIYSRKQSDFWAEVASTSDPAAFFRIDFVVAALRWLDHQSSMIERSPMPTTLIELDSLISQTHGKLTQRFSGQNYVEMKRAMQRSMQNCHQSSVGR